MKDCLKYEDYVVLIGMLFVSWIIGCVVACSHRKAFAGDGLVLFLVGDRKIGVFMAAISIAVTCMSSWAIVGLAAEVYYHGAQCIVFALGCVIAVVLSAVFIVPVYRQYPYISIYEYLERRYSKSMRRFFSAIYILAEIGINSVVLYVPALCLWTLTGIPYWVSILVSGCACTFYCTMGGFKAIIYTDFLQAAFMVICNFLVICFGVNLAGGIKQVWDDGVRGHRVFHVTLLEDDYTRYSVWSLFFGGLAIMMYNMVASQSVLQRTLSVRKDTDAQSATILGGLFIFLFHCSTAVAAIVIYSNFFKCDSSAGITEIQSESGDPLYIHAIGEFLKHPGLKGLALAGIFSGSLSTVSSAINAFAALTLEDFISPILKYFRRSFSSETKLITCKILTLIYGLVCIALAVFVPLLGGITRTVIQIAGVFGGPQTAVIILGMFCRKANNKGVFIGLILGIAFNVWINAGALVYQRKYTTLSLINESCYDDFAPKLFENETFLEMQLDLNERSVPDFIPTTDLQSTTELILTENFDFNYTFEDPLAFTLNKTELKPKYASTVFPLYRLSFMWYGPLGFIITYFIGLVASEVIGNEKRTVDPRLLSVFVGGVKNEIYERTSAVLISKRIFSDDSSIGNANDLQCTEDSYVGETRRL